MARKEVTKKVYADICDFCDEEIEHNEDYCYSHLISTDRRSKEHINRWVYKVTHIVFSWYRPKDKDKPEAVMYDFHAKCFDKLMTKFLKESK